MENRLENIDINTIQVWVNTGAVEGLDPSIVRYLEQIEVARSLYAKYNSNPAIVKILMSTNPGMTRRYAQAIINDSLNFFYANNDIKKEAWRNIYAEKLENAALVAWDKSDIEEYRRCIVSAAEMRGLDKVDPPTLPPELLDRRPVIHMVDSSRVGIRKEKRTEVANFIDNLEITEKEKDSLRADAGIIDIDFEDAENIPE